MPRPRRYELADVPQHVVQRGNNRQQTFFEAADYQRYLDWLREAACRHQCDIHAYVLMPNHVHLLVTPRAPMAIAKLMQSIGRKYVRRVNDRQGRSGTMWEGRYKASLVSTGRYLMNCYRYIELNPVRAALVAHPAEYLWSSHRRNALGFIDPIVTEHREFTALAEEPAARIASYRELFLERMGDEVLTDIRRNLEQCRAFGPDAFKDEIEVALGRRVRAGSVGRRKSRVRCLEGPVSVRRV